MCKKTVLITGASRGIGKAIALEFAKKGHPVAINCLNSESALIKTKNQIEQLGGTCFASVADVGNINECKRFYQQTEQELGAPEILINNAGISYSGLLQTMDPDDWDRMIRTNLTSVFYLSKLVIPHMLSIKKGKILNISSVWGNVGASCEVAYSTSKGGINTFTKALAKELAPSNIQVNAIACGAINTEMNGFLTEKEKQDLSEEIPSGRFGETSEVSHLAYQLCCENQYLTGQVIQLDGGWI